jgi:hypothetical protein
MNLGEMRETLARDVLQRDDVNESLTTAIQFSHKEIQRTKDWRAMEERATGLDYNQAVIDANGITVAADYKRAREVYIVDGIDLKSVLPSTEQDVNKLRRIAFNTRGIVNPSEGGYIQRWYESRLKIVLFIPVEVILAVEYYKYLAPIALADDTDYFTENIPQIVIWGAAYYMSKYIFEDARAQHFLDVYKQLLEEAYIADVQAKLQMNKPMNPRQMSRESQGTPAGGQ